MEVLKLFNELDNDVPVTANNSYDKNESDVDFEKSTEDNDDEKILENSNTEINEKGMEVSVSDDSSGSEKSENKNNQNDDDDEILNIESYIMNKLKISILESLEAKITNTDFVLSDGSDIFGVERVEDENSESESDKDENLENSDSESDKDENLENSDSECDKDENLENSDSESYKDEHLKNSHSGSDDSIILDVEIDKVISKTSSIVSNKDKNIEISIIYDDEETKFDVLSFKNDEIVDLKNDIAMARCSKLEIFGIDESAKFGIPSHKISEHFEPEIAETESDQKNKLKIPSAENDEHRYEILNIDDDENKLKSIKDEKDGTVKVNLLENEDNFIHNDHNYAWSFTSKMPSSVSNFLSDKDLFFGFTDEEINSVFDFIEPIIAEKKTVHEEVKEKKIRRKRSAPAPTRNIVHSSPNKLLRSKRSSLIKKSKEVQEAFEKIKSIELTIDDVTDNEKRPKITDNYFAALSLVPSSFKKRFEENPEEHTIIFKKPKLSQRFKKKY